MTTSLKLCTLNTKGLNDRTKRDQLIMWMKNKSFDIIFLQEIHYKLCKENNFKWSNNWNGQTFLSGNSSNSCGVGILISNDINISILEYKDCVIGR